jgi:chromosome segregation ATPase
MEGILGIRARRMAQRAQQEEQNQERTLLAKLDETVVRIKELEAQIGGLDDEKKALDAEVKAIMTKLGRSEQRSGLFKVIYKMTSPKDRFDSKKYQEDHPKECAAYMVPGKPSEFYRIQ